MDKKSVFDNERYVSYWFVLDSQNMSYCHKVENIEVSREKMDNLIHTQNLQGLLKKLGINHEEVLKKSATTTE